MDNWKETMHKVEDGKATLDYGKSMYGGWYMEYMEIDADGYRKGFTGKGFDTYREMKAYAKQNGIELNNRVDNE